MAEAIKVFLVKSRLFIAPAFQKNQRCHTHIVFQKDVARVRLNDNSAQKRDHQIKNSNNRSVMLTVRLPSQGI